MQRISITVDESLAQAFDELIAKRGYQNRSEAFLDFFEINVEKISNFR